MVNNTENSEAQKFSKINGSKDMLSYSKGESTAENMASIGSDLTLN